jgi:hypothetical protein
MSPPLTEARGVEGWGYSPVCVCALFGFFFLCFVSINGLNNTPSPPGLPLDDALFYASLCVAT